MRRLSHVEPGQVWFVGFDPVRGREQGKDRPALVVSSRFHLDLTMRQLICVLPLTSVERTGWVHRVHVASRHGWVIPEQIRTWPPSGSAATHPRSSSPLQNSTMCAIYWRKC